MRIAKIKAERNTHQDFEEPKRTTVRLGGPGLEQFGRLRGDLETSLRDGELLYGTFDDGLECDYSCGKLKAPRAGSMSINQPNRWPSETSFQDALPRCACWQRLSWFPASAAPQWYQASAKGKNRNRRQSYVHEDIPGK